jgi:hypothetical protein
LPRGSPREVKEDVKRKVEILNKDGRYVFNQIQKHIPFSSFYKMDRRDACPTGEERLLFLLSQEVLL